MSTRGLIILKSNYSYEGDIINNEPHGKGMFTYDNNDIFIGECKYGKPDGFGIYKYKSGARYIGFFSYGKIHGVGTFEDEKNIYKGTWRCDKKHGIFYRTRKATYSTFLQNWIRGKLLNFKETQYIQPAALQTTKDNPIKSHKKYQLQYKGKHNLCLTCCDNCTNATNSKCGHVVMCYECLKKCEKCPICRAPIEKIIRLFIN